MFFIEEFYLVNAKEMAELENHSFGKPQWNKHQDK